MLTYAEHGVERSITPLSRPIVPGVGWEAMTVTGETPESADQRDTETS